MNEPDALVLPTLGDPVDELWEVFLDLAERLKVDWTIVGGQMVLLHALEHGTVPPTVSQDGDVIADVRATRKALRKVAAVLEAMGFEGRDRQLLDLVGHALHVNSLGRQLWGTKGTRRHELDGPAPLARAA